MNNSTADLWKMMVEMQRQAFKKYQLIPLSIIITIGFLANVIVICAGLKERFRKKYTTNAYILSLATADLGVILYFIPIHMVEYTKGLDVSDWTCKYVIPVRETFVIVSIFSVAGLGMVRFLQIHFSYVFSKRNTYLTIAFMWFVAYLAVSMPLSFVIRHTSAMTCDHFWDDDKHQRLHIIMLNVIQFVPLLITTACYLSIIRKVRNINHETSGSEVEVTQGSRELSVLMLTLIAAAWSSLGPFLVYSFVMIFQGIDEFPFRAWSAVAILLTSSSAVNPVLILLMNRDYRYEVRNKIYKKKAMLLMNKTRTSFLSVTQPGVDLRLSQGDGGVFTVEKSVP